MPVVKYGRTRTIVVKKTDRLGRPRGHRRYGKTKIPRGLKPITIPMKVGYTYDIIGDGNAYKNFDQDLGLNKVEQAWFTRYEPMFSHIKVNKVAIEISCPYNIGQHNVGTQSLYRMYYKKAFSTAETPPGSVSEWLNMQSAKTKIFSGKTNSVNLYFTPAFESRQQPLNAGNTSLKLLYKQWSDIQDTNTKMTPMIGFIGQIVRLDGSAIGNTNVFKVNVRMYCTVRGIKQL